MMSSGCGSWLLPSTGRPVLPEGQLYYRSFSLVYRHTERALLLE